MKNICFLYVNTRTQFQTIPNIYLWLAIYFKRWKNRRLTGATKSHSNWNIIQLVGKLGLFFAERFFLFDSRFLILFSSLFVFFWLAKYVFYDFLLCFCILDEIREFIFKQTRLETIYRRYFSFFTFFFLEKKSFHVLFDRQ